MFEISESVQKFQLFGPIFNNIRKILNLTQFDKGIKEEFHRVNVWFSFVVENLHSFDIKD